MSSAARWRRWTPGLADIVGYRRAWIRGDLIAGVTVAVASILLVLSFGRGVLAHFPTAALGALVIYAALALIDSAGYRRLATFRRARSPPSTTTTDRSSGPSSTPEANVEVDLTALDALDELRQELGRRNVVFAMARVKQDLRHALAAAGMIDRIGDDRI